MKTAKPKPPKSVDTERRNREIRGMNKKTTNSIKQLRMQLLDDKGKIFNQSQLCEALGLSPNSRALISSCEKGMEPSADVIAKLEALAKEHSINWSYQP